MFTLPALLMSDPASPVFVPEADPSLRILVACLYVLIGISVVVVAALISYLLLRASREEADQRAKHIGILLISIVLVLTGTSLLDNSQQESVAADQQKFRTWLDGNYPQAQFKGGEVASLLAGKTVRQEGPTTKEWSLVPAGEGVPGYRLEVSVPED